YEIKTISFPPTLAQIVAAPGGAGGLNGLGCFLRRRTGALWPRRPADSFRKLFCLPRPGRKEPEGRVASRSGGGSKSNPPERRPHRARPAGKEFGHCEADER